MNEFPGKIGQTVNDSEPWWPKKPHRDELPPNIVTIIFDDTGWADFGCFGSEIKTPNIDALAKKGLRFNSFHVTPLCSPTRASFLSGRNHHKVGMSCLADTDTGFPNSRGVVHQDVPLVSELLRDEGFGTYMVGKWHLTPAHEVTPAGPHENWPVNRGFDRYYGFLGGCTDQYSPELVQDNHAMEPPNDDDYHLSEDLADRAINYLRDHAAFRKDCPFFLNFCFGATHAPIQVDRKYIDPYVPVFEKGWDQTREDRLARQKEMGLVPEDTDLVARNPEVPAWDELDDDAKKVYTRLQASFAGFLEHSDEQIGRLVQELKRLDMFDNTLILVLSDNGASREGGDHGAVDVNTSYSGQPKSVAEMVDDLDDVGGRKGPAMYPQGWAMAGNTPFRRYKQFVELGGVRSPLVVSWPMGLEDEGEIRDQFLHVIDIAPTIMDMIGRNNVSPMDGSSFLSALQDKDARSPRDTQYWEMFGRRAIYHNGWKAVSQHEKGDEYGADHWHLYDTRQDFSESRDVSAKYPEKLSETIDLWWREAEANSVMPLDDRTLVDIINFRQPNGLMAQKEITLYAGQTHIPQISMITASERHMNVGVKFRGELGDHEGVLLAAGDNVGGYTIYIQNGQLNLEHIWQKEHFKLSCELSASVADVAVNFEPKDDHSSDVQLLVDGTIAASGTIPCISNHLSFWGLDVGRDAAIPVSNAYQTPFAFCDEKLENVVITYRDHISPEAVAALHEAVE